MARLRSVLGFLAAAWIACPAANAAAFDMAKADELRSAVAEAAALEQAQAAGQVTDRYASGLRDDLARTLQKLDSDPDLGPVAKAALAALQRRDATALRAWRDRLVTLERAHGRAG